MLQRSILGFIILTPFALFSVFAAEVEPEPNAKIRQRFEAIPVPQTTPFDTDKKHRAMYLGGYRSGYFWAESSRNHFIASTNPSESNGPAIRGWIDGWRAGIKAGGTEGLPSKYASVVRWDPEGTHNAGDWSQPVNGLQARLSFAVNEAISETPIVTTYLELRNVSEIANVMEIPFNSEQVEFLVTTADGKPVEPAYGPFDGMEVPLGMTRLPFDSTLRMNIAARGAGIRPGAAAHLDLGPKFHWSFQKGDDGACFLTAVIKIAESERGLWSGQLEIPPVKIPMVGK